MNIEDETELINVLKEVSKEEDIDYDKIEERKKQEECSKRILNGKVIIDFIGTAILYIKKMKSISWMLMVDIGSDCTGEDIRRYKESIQSFKTLYIYYILYIVLLIINPILYYVLKNKSTKRPKNFFKMCFILEIIYLVIYIIRLILLIKIREIT